MQINGTQETHQALLALSYNYPVEEKTLFSHFHKQVTSNQEKKKKKNQESSHNGSVLDAKMWQRLPVADVYWCQRGPHDPQQQPEVRSTVTRSRHRGGPRQQEPVPLPPRIPAIARLARIQALHQRLQATGSWHRRIQQPVKLLLGPKTTLPTPE